MVRSTFSFWPTRLSPRRASHHIFKRHIYCRARGLTRTVAAKRFQPFQHDSQQTLTVFVVFRLRRLLRSLSQHSIHHLAFYVCALCASFADFCFLRNLFVRVSALLSNSFRARHVQCSGKSFLACLSCQSGKQSAISYPPAIDVNIIYFQRSAPLFFMLIAT